MAQHATCPIKCERRLVDAVRLLEGVTRRVNNVEGTQGCLRVTPSSTGVTQRLELPEHSGWSCACSVGSTRSQSLVIRDHLDPGLLAPASPAKIANLTYLDLEPVSSRSDVAAASDFARIAGLNGVRHEPRCVAALPRGYGRK